MSAPTSFRPVTPAEGPAWLPRFASSISDLFRRIMPQPLRLKDYATADLPPAADFKQGLAYDSSASGLALSDGSGWRTFSFADHVHAAAEITFAPAGGIAAADVQAAIAELDSEKAAASHGHAISDVSGLQAALDGKAASVHTHTLSQISDAGTAAAEDIGTSGDTVPKLNGANIWSGAQDVAATVRSTDRTVLTTGAGIEFSYSTAFNAGTMMCVDHDADVGRIMTYGGSQMFFQIFSTASASATAMNISGTFINMGSGVNLRANGTQVVTTRRTGWGSPTGTATRTAFATSTVTTAELAERVKALIDDMRTHGLIGN